jgi:hypothetical protein
MDAPQNARAFAAKRVDVKRIEGDALFIVGATAPEIPSEQTRECPQCARRTWRLSRHCWYCRFDFAGTSSHAFFKLLLLIAVANLAGAVALVLVLASRGEL